MIIAVSHVLKIPAASVLELLGNRPPVEIFFNPVKWWHTVCRVGLEQIEKWSEPESASCHNLPKSDPFQKPFIFINYFTFFETKSWIRIHRRGLYERLELISRMSRSSLNSENALKGCFGKLWETKSRRHVREFLILCPFNLIFWTFVVIIVRSCGTVLQSFTEVYVLCLGFKYYWLSPSVVKLEMLIGQGLELRFCKMSLLREAGRHVAFLMQVFRTHLGNM